MNFKKISIMLMLSLTVWAQSATPAAGAPKDRDEAAFHYHMGLNYYDGLGEPPDYAKAVDHFKRAATLNHSQAQGQSQISLAGFQSNGSGHYPRYMINISPDNHDSTHFGTCSTKTSQDYGY